MYDSFGDGGIVDVAVTFDGGWWMLLLPPSSSSSSSSSRLSTSQFRFQNATDVVKNAIWIGFIDGDDDGVDVDVEPADGTIVPNIMNKSRTVLRKVDEKTSHRVNIT